MVPRLFNCTSMFARRNITSLVLQACLTEPLRLLAGQTEKGKQQALGAGHAIRAMMEQDGKPYNLFFYTSPYKRSRQTFEEIGKAIDPASIIGAQEEVQLREQDFGNFQARSALHHDRAFMATEPLTGL